MGGRRSSDRVLTEAGGCGGEVVGAAQAQSQPPSARAVECDEAGAVEAAEEEHLRLLNRDAAEAWHDGQDRLAAGRRGRAGRRARLRYLSGGKVARVARVVGASGCCRSRSAGEDSERDHEKKPLHEPGMGVGWADGVSVSALCSGGGGLAERERERGGGVE